MKHKNSTAERNKFSLLSAIKTSIRFIKQNKYTFTCWFFVNVVFLYVFSLIPNGWTNYLSILWLVAYYVYWCIYMRYIQQHPPYFSLIRIFNGLIPASKIMFINICLYLMIVIVPYIPLFMGFKDKYLEFFEWYMGIMQSYDSLLGRILFYIFMILISPYTLSRPYLAWISSLVGKNRSIRIAFLRTRGYYSTFVFCALVMSMPFVISYYVDTIFHLHTLMFVMAILSVYFNVVFINIYKAFYKRQIKNTV